MIIFRYPKPTRAPTKRDIDRAIKERTLQEIRSGKIDVKATMERDEELTRIENNRREKKNQTTT